MHDIVLESIRAFILLFLIIYLFLRSRNHPSLRNNRGWLLIYFGFCLLFFGTLLDITDNFDSLNRFVVIGDTEVEAFLEKMIGYLGGFVFLSAGFVYWIPTVTSVKELNKLVAALKLSEEKSMKNYQVKHALELLLQLSLEKLPLKEILRRAIEIIFSAPFLPLDPKGAIFIVDGESDKLCLAANVGFLEEHQTLCAEVPFGRCTCGKAAEIREIVFVDKVDECHDIRYEGMEPHGHYCVPILSGEKLLGVICLYLDEGECRREEDVQFLGAVAVTLAGIIERRWVDDQLCKLSVAVEQNPATIAITDTEGNIEYVNPQFTRATGYTAEEAIGQNPRILKSGDQADKFYKELWDTITAGKTWRGDFHNKRKNGELYWESASISPIKAENGDIINFVAIKTDVTLRRAQEEEIRRKHIEEEVLNYILTLSLEDMTFIELIDRCLEEILSVPFMPIKSKGAIFTIDEGSKTLTMVTQKGLPESLLGQCSKLPFGKCLCGRVAKSGKTEFADCIDACHEIRYEGMEPHGHYCVPIKTKKKVLGIINLYLDVGCVRNEDNVAFMETVAATLAGVIERKKIEERLRKAKEEAEEATKLKDKFVSLVSHDLKNPLSRIMGYFQLIQFTQQPSDKANGMIEEGLLACDDMTTLINDILSLSRIKAGKIRPEDAFIDAYDIAISVISSYTLMANAKEVKLTSEIPKHANIYADEKLLNQVLSNLVSNAIKFCEKGDTVKLHLPPGELSTIAVTDTGVGIEPERIDTIFQYEESNSTIGTSGETGTGFGLPLAHDIIEAHGGDLQVESTLGEGSTFFIRLPHVNSPT